MADVGLQYLSADVCRSDPLKYKLCTSSICVRIGSICPCQHGVEFRCSDGQCVPLSARCNGSRQCSSGEDELGCADTGQLVTSSSDRLPVEMVIGIVAVCLIVCVATLFLLLFLVSKRRKNNTSRESQSVTQPLKTRYPSTVIDTSNKFDEPSSTKRDYVYHQMYDAPEDFELAVDRNGPDSILPNQTRIEEQITKPRTKTFVPDIYAVKTMKIYDFDHDLNNSVNLCEKGKYIFKPRRKKVHVQTDIKMKRASENHEIVHSYKHVDKNRFSLPAAFNFDIDPDNFSSTFATELLCSSTPRQPARRLFLHGSHQSLSEDEIISSINNSRGEKINSDMASSKGCPKDNSIKMDENIPLSIPNGISEHATIYV